MISLGEMARKLRSTGQYLGITDVPVESPANVKELPAHRLHFPEKACKLLRQGHSAQRLAQTAPSA